MIKGTVEANEFTYYRYINPNPNKLISITMKPTCDHYGHLGDADLYITNRYNPHQYNHSTIIIINLQIQRSGPCYKRIIHLEKY